MFWQNFWPNFVSDSIVALFFGVFLTWLINWSKRPNLLLVLMQNNKFIERIKATKINDEYEVNISITIKNDGYKTLGEKECYWHVYFPYPNLEIINNTNCEYVNPNHFRALTKAPIFPHSVLDTNSNIVIRFKAIDKENFLYWFLSTQYGTFPKSIKIDQKTGIASFQQMNKIPIDF